MEAFGPRHPIRLWFIYLVLVLKSLAKPGWFWTIQAIKSMVGRRAPRPRSTGRPKEQPQELNINGFQHPRVVQFFHCDTQNALAVCESLAKMEQSSEGSKSWPYDVPSLNMLHRKTFLRSQDKVTWACKGTLRLRDSKKVTN